MVGEVEERFRFGMRLEMPGDRGPTITAHRGGAVVIAANAERHALGGTAGKFRMQQRIELLLGKGSFEKFDMSVARRSTEFSMEKIKISGDSLQRMGSPQNGRWAIDRSCDGRSQSASVFRLKCRGLDRCLWFLAMPFDEISNAIRSFNGLRQMGKRLPHVKGRLFDLQG